MKTPCLWRAEADRGAVANMHQTLEMIDAGAPSVDLLVGQSQKRWRGRLGSCKARHGDLSTEHECLHRATLII